MDHIFLTKSRKLKEYLVRSLNQALNQIEQWCPDPTADEMDWQHEEEIVVPQPQDVCYVWDAARADFHTSRSEGESSPRRRDSANEMIAADFGGKRAQCAHMREILRRENASQQRFSALNMLSSYHGDSAIV